MTNRREDQNRVKKVLTTCKERDFLDQDPPIRNQNYVCLSFISPEDVIIKKENFNFSEFIKCFANDINILFENLKARFKDENGIVETIDSLKDRYDYIYNASNLQKEYDFFKEQNNTFLDKTFLENNDFQTNVRGIKVRGSFETLPEAQNRVQEIRKFDKAHNVYIGQVGCWCPWSPYPNEIKNQEYNESTLNTLMKKYNENMTEKDDHHKKRIEIEKNKQKKQPTIHDTDENVLS